MGVWLFPSVSLACLAQRTSAQKANRRVRSQEKNKVYSDLGVPGDANARDPKVMIMIITIRVILVLLRLMLLMIIMIILTNADSSSTTTTSNDNGNIQKQAATSCLLTGCYIVSLRTCTPHDSCEHIAPQCSVCTCVCFARISDGTTFHDTWLSCRVPVKRCLGC